MVAVVTTCKGRLGHLVHTLPNVLLSPVTAHFIVDYSCPQRTGDEIEAAFPEEVASGKIVVVRVPGQEGFNKCRANNIGAKAAIERGHSVLTFLDADTIVHPKLFNFIDEHINPQRFMIVSLRDDGSDIPDLTGFIALTAENFLRSGGYDETFQGWGAEDLEFRLRLSLKLGLDYLDTPHQLMRAIPHSNEMRTTFYDTKNNLESDIRNTARLRQMVAEWDKVRPVEDADRLWYQRYPTREVP